MDRARRAVDPRVVGGVRPLLALLSAAFLGPAAAAPQGATPLPVETAQVIASFPHDRTAFTQGLLIHDGALYESTGRIGTSEVRRVDLNTGRVRARATLPGDDFGEGIAAHERTLVSVTWHGGRGYRWSLPGLKRVGSFRYAGEGWGMTSNGRAIILSDGTPTLRFLDPATLAVTRTLRVTVGGRPLPKLNELEWVEGEILANIWMTPYVARIDPTSGAVRGFLDLTPLVERVALEDTDAVANGIAWDAARRKLYVTGKNWPTLFEVAWRGG
jgi:glutamine cyclotransferase